MEKCKHDFDPVSRSCTKCGEHIYDSLINEETEFECCGECDQPDACADFGCAIKQGLKEPDEFE